MSETDVLIADEIRLLGFDDSGAVISQLARISSVVRLSAGTLLFSEGELHDRLYFVCAGTVSLEMVTTRCGKKRILTAGPGDMLAWSGLLGDGRMTASAMATDSVRLLEFPVDALRSLCRTDHDVGYVVMTRIATALSRRLVATRLQLLDLYQFKGG